MRFSHVCHQMQMHVFPECMVSLGNVNADTDQDDDHAYNEDGGDTKNGDGDDDN